MVRTSARLRFALLVASVATGGYATPRPLWAEDTETPARASLRHYEDGPLTADDYRAEPPSQLPREGSIRLLAHTWARLTYDYRYSWREQQNGVVMTLRQWDVTAAVDRDESWNSVPNDDQLMDHEQGHFDLAYIAALKLRLNARELQRQGKPIRGTGRTREAAEADLVDKLDARIRDMDKASAEVHLQYDRMTRFGAIGSAQAEARKTQRNEINELTRALQSEAVENALLNGR